MVKCAAFGCGNRSFETAKGISFHKFPANLVRRRAWADAAQGPDWIPLKTSALCSEHFEEKCFDRTGQIVRLREKALPTIFACEPEKINSTHQSKQEVSLETSTAGAGTTTVEEQTTNMGLESSYTFLQEIALSTGPRNKVCTTKMAKTKEGNEKKKFLCRLCGKLKDDVTSIFSAKGATLQLREKLEHLLRITVTEGDKLPKFVCDKCVMQLNMCDSVMEFFKQTQSSLQEVLYSESTHDEAPVSSVNEDVISNEIEPQVSAEPVELNLPKDTSESEDNDLSDMQGTNNTEFDPATLDEDVLFSMHGINITLPVPCDFCEEMFDDLETFDAHIANHKEQRVFSCQLCSNTYVSWNNLMAHRKACHGSKVLSCDKCNSRTYHPDLAPVNYAVKDFPVGCEECEEGFNTMVELSRHYKVSVSHHTNCTSIDQVMSSTNDSWNEVGTNSEDGDTDPLHNTFPMNVPASETNVVDGLQPSAMCVDFVCSLCGGQFPTSEELDQHVAKLQDDSPDLYCSTCDMRFCDKDMFSTHQQLHSSIHNHISHKDFEETRAKCEHCGDATDCKHLTDLNRTPPKEEFACFDCSITYAKLGQLETHVNAMHSSCKAVTCDVCKKRFGADAFVCHYVECLASKNNDRNLVQFHSKTCSKCNNMHAQALASKHLKESNSTKKLHTCEVCHKQINRLDRIVQHAKSHYGPDECNLPAKYVEMIRLLGGKKQSPRGQQETFRCDYCGKVFASKVALLSHVRLHTKANTYVCQLCSKAFVTEKHLMVHVLRHTNEQAHECEQCLKVFTSSESFQVHKMTHAGPYTCPHCDKTLSGRISYLGHIRLHTGERPYKCIRCSRAFTLKERLNLHMKLKHGTTASSDNDYDFDEMEECEET